VTAPDRVLLDVCTPTIGRFEARTPGIGRFEGRTPTGRLEVRSPAIRTLEADRRAAGGDRA
jgi:hypothetical protein